MAKIINNTFNVTYARFVLHALDDIESKKAIDWTFSHLEKGTDYTCAVQTTLYEFDENNDGPKGPMYLTLNSRLLQDTNELCEALSKVMKKVME